MGSSGYLRPEKLRIEGLFPLPTVGLQNWTRISYEAVTIHLRILQDGFAPGQFGQPRIGYWNQVAAMESFSKQLREDSSNWVRSLRGLLTNSPVLK
jgi:hypothetical protein